MIDLASLKAALEAATFQPPWSAHKAYTHIEIWTGTPEQQMHGYRICTVDRHVRDASYDPHAALIVAAVNALPSLIEEVERLRKDAERYRWLRDKSVPPHNFYLSVPIEFDGVRYTPPEVDAAIDAAIGEKA